MKKTICQIKEHVIFFRKNNEGVIGMADSTFFFAGWGVEADLFAKRNL